MFSLPVRIALIVAALAYGVYNLINGKPTAVLLLLGVSLLVFGYFRYGAIRPAYLAMRRGDLRKARKHFDTIRFPKLLSAESRAYWHWVNAILAAEESNNLSCAEDEMRQAIDGKLRTSNDRCLATAILAQIVAKNGNPEQAVQILEQAEQIPHREGATIYLNQVRSELLGEPTVPGA